MRRTCHLPFDERVTPRIVLICPNLKTRLIQKQNMSTLPLRVISSVSGSFDISLRIIDSLMLSKRPSVAVMMMSPGIVGIVSFEASEGESLIQFIVGGVHANC